MLTNFKTIQSRIARLKEIETMEEDGTFDVLPKKEVIKLKEGAGEASEEPWRYQGNEEDFQMLSSSLILRRKESVFRKHMHLVSKLIGIADTNCDPDELDYVIPGNDDAIRAVKLNRF